MTFRREDVNPYGNCLSERKQDKSRGLYHLLVYAIQGDRANPHTLMFPPILFRAPFYSLHKTMLCTVDPRHFLAIQSQTLKTTLARAS